MSSTLNDVFRSYPIHIPLSNLPDLKSLPDSYTWTPKDDLLFSASASASDESLPLIDLSDLHVTNLVGHACTTWGAFQIINHGVPSQLLDDIEFLTGSLFRLPVHRKLKAARSENGVSGYGVARIASFFNKQMWSEGFTITGSPLHDFRKLWPSHHPKYCGIIEEYEDEMEKLATRLLSCILGSLGGVTVDDIEWTQKLEKSEAKVGRGAIRLNHYPVCPEPERAMGLAAHTDSTILTILHQSNTGGLQVFTEGCGWVTVEPDPGILVVNMGDLFQILSNGKIPSVVHRAKVNHTRSRISIAYLWGGPAGDVEIKPISIIGPVGASLYRSVTWKEYLRIKYEVFDKALDAIRVVNPTD